MLSREHFKANTSYASLTNIGYFCTMCSVLNNLILMATSKMDTTLIHFVDRDRDLDISENTKLIHIGTSF